MPDALPPSTEGMPVDGLVTALARQDIRLWLEGDGLRFDAPAGAMTPALKDTLRARKPEIVAYLATGATQAPATVSDASADTPIRPAPDGVSHPTAFAQRRLWYLHRLNPDDDAYNAPIMLELSGPLDRTALTQALNDLVARHEILRTVYADGVDGEPVQRIKPVEHFTLPVLPLQAADGDGPEDRTSRAEGVAAEVRAFVTRPFDLTIDPPLRGCLVHQATDQWLLVLVLHHIAADGWSLGIIVREVQALYAAAVARQPAALPRPDRQYRDFAHWQRSTLTGDRLDGLVAYWRQALDGAPTQLPLPADAARVDADPKPSDGQRGVDFVLAAAVADRLQAFARSEQATLFMLAAAAYGTVLARLTDQTEVLVGAAIANRTRMEIEALVGLFVNTLPLRVSVDGNPSFRALVRRVKAVALSAFAHQDLPFDRMVEAIQPERTDTTTPIVQAILVVQNAPVEAWHLADLTVRPIRPPVDRARNHLELHIWSRGVGDDTAAGMAGIGGILYYDANRFSADTAGRFADHIRATLVAMANQPDGMARAVPLATAGAQQQLLAVPPLSPAPPLVMTAFAHMAAAQPDRIALDVGDITWRYGDLAAQVDRTAQGLSGLGFVQGDRVGLLFPPGPAAIMAILACWQAGLAYVPLSLDDPPARTEDLIRDSGARLILTDQPGGSAIGGDLIPVLTLAELAARAQAAPPPDVHPETPAYLLYTSGSTGRPKGVLISHGGLANLAKAQAAAFHVDAESRVLQFAPLTFDASVSEIVIALTTGATLCVANRPSMQPGAPLANLMRDRRITKVTLPPSILSVLPETPPLTDLATLVVAGEACPPDLARRWGQGRRLVNAYGPTENTVCATWFADRGDAGPLPIGRAMAGVETWVLDDLGQPVPPGVPGQLYLGGAGLALGYWGQPDQTAIRFGPHPFAGATGARLYATGDRVRYDRDGILTFLGRIDTEVKLRGMRIDVQEIEHRLRELPPVADAAVVVAGDAPQTAQLRGFVVLKGDTDPTHEAVTGTADHLAAWQQVFDATLTDNRAEGAATATDPLFNSVGWHHSADGSPIAEAEMRDWCRDVIDLITAQKPEAILELGCGTGMLLWPLARVCKRYRGVDVSPTAVAYINQQIAAHTPDYNHVSVSVGTADDPPDVPDAGYDVVLLHSIIQYFPDIPYLDRVLERARRAVKPGGMIVIGDVRNLALHRCLVAGIVCGARAGPGAGADRGDRIQRVADRMAEEQELLVHPGYFHQLAQPRSGVASGIAAARFRLQRGAVPNELNRYRYTVVLETVTPEAAVPLSPVDGTGTTLADIRRRLLISDPHPQAWTGLSNQHLATDRTAEAALFPDTPAPASGDVTPEALYRLAEDVGLEVEVSWTRVPGDGRLDVVFYPRGQRPPALPLAASGPAEAPCKLGSDPLASRRAHAVTAAARRHLEQHLPAHMVPARLQVEDSLPLTRHGKVDRQALARRIAIAPPRIVRAPSNRIEAQVAETFAETLNQSVVSPDADFFRLGGHSLLAVALADRLAQRFGIDIPLATLVADPTPRAVAAWITQASSSPTPRSPHIVRLGGGSGGTPLFLMPPAAGSPLCYLGFVAALTPSFPVWGLQCPGLVDGETPAATVEALADTFVAAIKQVQPQGPYRLAGWSFGGIPAYACATRLIDAGDRIELLALIDSGVSARGVEEAGTGAPAANGIGKLIGFGALVGQMARLRGKGTLRHLAQAAGVSLPQSARWSAWTSAWGQSRRTARVFSTNMKAAEAYDPPPYAGSVHLFRAGTWPSADPIERQVRHHVRGPVTVHPVEATHMGLMLDTAMVGQFADAFWHQALTRNETRTLASTTGALRRQRGDT